MRFSLVFSIFGRRSHFKVVEKRKEIGVRNAEVSQTLEENLAELEMVQASLNEVQEVSVFPAQDVCTLSLELG